MAIVTNNDPWATAQVQAGPAITDPARALYEWILRTAGKEGARYALPTPGYLRSEVRLGAQSELVFGMRKDESNGGLAPAPWEQRLDLNDSFFMTHAAFFIYAAKVDEEGQATLEARAQARLQHFANANVFGGKTAQAVQAWNTGKLTVSVDDVIYIRDCDLASMQFADQAQEGTTYWNASTTPVSQNAVEGNRGFRLFSAPMVRLNGPSNNDVRVRFGLPIDWTDETMAYFAVMYLRGWRAQNMGIARS
jgi:hypothetical protein